MRCAAPFPHDIRATSYIGLNDPAQVYSVLCQSSMSSIPCRANHHITSSGEEGTLGISSVDLGASD